MQPQAPDPQNPYSVPQFAPNPYAQQTPGVPIDIPKTRSLSMGMIISFIVTLVLLLGAIVFGAWAFAGRQDYKQNSDKKVAVAVDAAKKQEAAEKDAAFAEEQKNPYKEYNGPSTYGSLKIVYPKTWSGLATETTGSTPVEAYFHPDYIPGIQSGTAIALHVRILNQSYNTVLTPYTAAAKKGDVKITPYTLPKVAGVVGSRVDGKLSNTIKSGSVVLLPLRDKTVEITTQSSDYVKDFDSIILANLTFQP